MDSGAGEGPERFAISRGFKWMCWACEVILAVLAGGCVFLALEDEGQAILYFGGSFLSGTLALLMLPTLRRLPEAILTDDRSITYEAPDGSRIELPWGQVAVVVDRPLLRRLEVHDAGGFTIIRLEYELDRFDRLLKIVLEKSAWEGLEELPDLPATFWSNASHPIVLLVLVLLTAGFVGFAVFAGAPRGLWMVLSGLGLLMLIEHRIRVDRSEIAFESLFRKRTIRIDEIEDVRLDTLRPGNGQVFLMIVIRMKNGKVRSIAAIQGGLLRLYRTLLAVVGDETTR